MVLLGGKESLGYEVGKRGSLWYELWRGVKVCGMNCKWFVGD